MKSLIDNQSVLNSLKAEFASFRAQSGPKARVPDGLRQAVLAAIARGIKSSLATRSSGITSKQIKIWRSLATAPNAECVSPKEQARILNVTASSPPGLRVSYEEGRLLLEFSF